jgi:hypothetical protein
MKIQIIHQSTDQEFVDITWQIVYSGQSNLKLMLSEAFPGFAYNMTETKEAQQEMQLTAEFFRQCIILTFVALVLIRLVEGLLLGNQVRNGSHPLRRFFVSILV